MDIAIVTGSTGLIGSEAVRFLSKKEMTVVGIDNDMRKEFFGEEASTNWNKETLERDCKDYRHFSSDIRSEADMEKIFSEYGSDIKLIIHAAAQPSHDWASRDPVTDFTINANGSLILMEMTRKHCPEAVFILVSTNKVYGDTPNSLPLIELESRWEIDENHHWYERGIDESMSIDHSTHSLFGVSKTSADLLVQEYGKYFGIKTACFRCGCITGALHSGAELHGFLSYIVMCCIRRKPYSLLGYKGKQVRDNIHSYDLVNAFYKFYQNPKTARVYNIGGGRHSNCSMLEAIDKCEKITGIKLDWSYKENNRIGDHIWWISDVQHFKDDFPGWDYSYDLDGIIEDIYKGLEVRY